MRNAFVHFSPKCASLLMAGGLMVTAMTTAAMAQTRDLAYVTLPSAIEVGSATLPGGRYTISTAGDNVFLLHSDKGAHAFFLGEGIETINPAPKTEVVLRNDGEGLRLDKLYVAGDTAGYEFHP